MILLGLLFLLVINPSIPVDTVIVNSTVESAKVYLEGAQVTRTASITLNPGVNHLAFADLPASLNEETIRLTANADIIIRSISMNNDPKAGKQYAARLNDLKSQRENIETKISANNTALIVLERKINLLLANQDLSGKGASISVTELKNAVEYFGDTFTTIEQEKVELENQLMKLKQQLTEVNDEIQRIKFLQNLSAGVIETDIYSTNRQQVDARLSYVLSSAYWFPSYDVRVENIEKPMQLIYKANIHQSSGVDWENVNLSISSAEPEEGSNLPQIEPVYLRFDEPDEIVLRGVSTLRAENISSAGDRGISRVSGIVQNSQGEPIPTANVLVIGTNQGTATNSNGRFSLQVPPDAKYLRISFIGYKTRRVPIYSSNINVTLQQGDIGLDELVVTGYGAPVQTSLLEGQTAFTIQLDKPYTIQSGEPAKTVVVENYTVPAIYQYVTIPRENKQVYLTAKIADWDELYLLSGETNLYLGNAFVGSSTLNINTTADTLQFSLGADKSITINRTKIENFTEKNFFGSKVTETKGWNITVRNTKNIPIEIKVMDQVPLSANEDISVNLTERSGAIYDETTGTLTWLLKMPAQTTKTLSFIYEVEYPDDKRLNWN